MFTTIIQKTKLVSLRVKQVPMFFEPCQGKENAMRLMFRGIDADFYTMVDPKLVRTKLRQGRFTMIRLRFLSIDSLRKKKIKLIKEGQKLAKNFDQPIEYVGKNPESSSRKLLLEYYSEEK